MGFCFAKRGCDKLSCRIIIAPVAIPESVLMINLLLLSEGALNEVLSSSLWMDFSIDLDISCQDDIHIRAWVDFISDVNLLKRLN